MYDKVLTINPTFVDSLNNKGNALTKLAESIDITPVLFDYDNNDNNYYGFFKTSYNKLYYHHHHYFALSSSNPNLIPTKLDDALKQYDAALSIQPNATDILSNKGMLLIKLQRYDEANKVFDKILSIDPNNVAGLYNKGVALEMMGNADDGQMYQDQALQMNPGYSPDPINRVSLSVSASDQFSAAI